LQLYENCDQEKQLESIRYEVESTFGRDAEFYVPVHKERIGNKVIHTTLFEGYVFVKMHDKMDIAGCVNSIRGQCLEGPIYGPGGYHSVPDAEIRKYRKCMEDKLQSFMPEVGQRIVGKVGTFRNTEGEILSVDNKNREARVVFTMRSREVTATLNILNLAPLDELSDE